MCICAVNVWWYCLLQSWIEYLLLIRTEMQGNHDILFEHKYHTAVKFPLRIKASMTMETLSNNTTRIRPFYLLQLLVVHFSENLRYFLIRIRRTNLSFLIAQTNINIFPFSGTIYFYLFVRLLACLLRGALYGQRTACGIQQLFPSQYMGYRAPT